MIDPISEIELVASDLHYLQDLDYGSEPYQLDVSKWVKEEAAESMRDGTRVWMYTHGRTVLGYGSLGKSRWRYPEPDSKKVPILIVPSVGLAREFHGGPKGAERGDRYSSQIMRHLLREADAWPNRPLAIGLYVHADNVAAISLYERFSFSLFHNTFIDPNSGMTYRGYLRLL